MRRFSPLSIRVLAASLSACALVGCANPTSGMPTGANTSTPLPGTTTPPSLPGAAASSGAMGGGTVLASANGHSLTRDNAEAFVDALQFALGEIGRPKTFSQSEREQLIQGLAQNFATQPAEAQREVVKARETWTATRANWPTTSAADRQAFVDGVLAIAVGEQSAAQLTGRGGKPAGSGGDSWSAEAKEKCENGSYEDKMFYCYGVVTPPAPSW